MSYAEVTNYVAPIFLLISLYLAIICGIFTIIFCFLKGHSFFHLIFNASTHSATISDNFEQYQNKNLYP